MDGLSKKIKVSMNNVLKIVKRKVFSLVFFYIFQYLVIQFIVMYFKERDWQTI